MRAFGITPITTCPHCSKLVDGTCQMCEPGDTHPSCHQCEDGKIAIPWYQHDLFYAVLTAVTVSVSSALIVSAIQRRMKQK